MPEIWLRNNRRALTMGLLIPAVIELLGSAGLVIYFGAYPSVWVLIPSIALMSVGTLLMLSLLFAMQQPRLAYEEEQLLVYLDEPAPVRVPIDVVECFFLGQGPSFLPNLDGKESETSNVIVRLAESAHEWHHRDTKPQIAHWCEGYITLRGAWCEPISNEALGKLNKRLVEAHRARKARIAAGNARS